MPSPSSTPQLSYQKRDQALTEQRADWRRRWFGPSRKEVWSALARELSASFDEGTWRRGGKVVHQAGPWTLTLDLYLVSTGKTHIPYTRIRSPYLATEPFRCTLRAANFLTPLATFLGAQDLITGFPDFDAAFVVKATDPEKVRQFVGDAGFRARLMSNRNAVLSVIDDEGWFGAHFAPNVDELSICVLGDLRDLDQLHALFDLAADAMERLHAIGTAQPGETGLTLE